MKKALLVIVMMSSVLLACGPSKQEVEAKEKAKMDSVAKATQDQMAKAKEDKLKHDADSIANALTSAMNTDACNELKAKLEAAQDKLEDIKKFHIGRSSDEKEQQLQDQYKLIEDLKTQIKKCQ